MYSAKSSSSNGKKCYTFFSDLNEKWREFKMKLNNIYINIYHDKYWFPPNIYDKYRNQILFAMHSSRTIPDLMKKKIII